MDYINILLALTHFFNQFESVKLIIEHDQDKISFIVFIPLLRPSQGSDQSLELEVATSVEFENQMVELG